MAGRGRGGAGRGVRGTPSRGGGGPARGGRGGPVSVGGGGLPSTGEHVTTVGVKRLAFGTAGRQVSVFTNHYEIDIPSGIIYHYDGESCSSVH